MLDTSSPIPLYHQLAEALFAQIRAGAYAAGHKLPSEHELAASYGVGRPTVRQATDALIARGLVERKRGSGTYVRNVPVQVDLFSLAGTLVSFAKSGVALDSRLLGRPRTLGQDALADDEAHPLAGQAVVRIERLSRVDGTPVLLEAIDFALEHFPDLARQPLSGRSLSELVEQRYQLRAVCADQCFRVVALDARRAQLLGLRKRAPVLQVDRTLHFTRAKAAVFARMHCRTDRWVFSQRVGGHAHA